MIRWTLLPSHQVHRNPLPVIQGKQPSAWKKKTQSLKSKDFISKQNKTRFFRSKFKQIQNTQKISARIYPNPSKSLSSLQRPLNNLRMLNSVWGLSREKSAQKAFKNYQNLQKNGITLSHLSHLSHFAICRVSSINFKSCQKI